MNQQGYIKWLVLVIILFGSISFINSASKNSLPGDLIYPVKGIKEDIALVFTELNSKERAEGYINIEIERFNEALLVIKEKRKEEIIKRVLDDYKQAQKKAIDNLELAKNYGSPVADIAIQFEKTIDFQYDKLTELFYLYPEPVNIYVNEAMQFIGYSLIRIHPLKIK